MRFLLLLTALLVAVGCSRSPAAPGGAKTVSCPRRVEAGERPVQAIDRVLIISIDGLRPDLLLRAFTPRLRGLCSGGSYTFWAETTPEAYTLPSHVTMLTGVSAEKHGVTWNDYCEGCYPNVPTLFEVARQAGYSTAMATGKMKFVMFLKPGTVDHHFLPPDEPVSDRDVAGHAESLLRAHRPHVLFVHLADTDQAGHKYGWGSSEQIAVIERTDEAVGLILAVLGDLNLTDATLVIVTSDHGGAGTNHEMNDSRSHFIPWIASGPGIRKDFDLTLFRQRRVGTEDTFATACAFLGIDPGGECEGKPVLEILDTFRPKPVFAPPDTESSAVPQISASPNPVPAGPHKGKTTITWSAGEGNTGEVYLVTRDGTEKLFGGHARKGQQEAAFINADRVYEFRLYEGKEHAKLLASVNVTREKN
jgi:hypothetical protein